MIYLVDANVLSEPTKPLPNAKVVAWLAKNERDLCIDPIILGELGIGVLSLPRGRKRTKLENWFNELTQTIECVPWDSAISFRWSKLVAELRRKGDSMPLLDSMIAATALEHDLTVATRNTNDFLRAGVKLVNPFR